MSHDCVSRSSNVREDFNILLSILQYILSYSSLSMAELPPRKPQINEKDGVLSPGKFSRTDSPIKEPKLWTNLHLPAQLRWIPRNWTWSKLKPVIRCSIVAWVSAVLFIIPRVELLMGQVRFFWFLCMCYLDQYLKASFLILIGELLICLCDLSH